MFRADAEEPFTGPHQNKEVLHAGADIDRAEAAVILIHGRGAAAGSILKLSAELGTDRVYYEAPQAHKFTWYPYSFLMPEEQNQPGLNSGLQVIHDRIGRLSEQGIPQNRILLAGFSQGACLVSEYAARHPAVYGGVAVFSGGLIGNAVDPDLYSGSMEQTPVFLGCSDSDSHIPLERVEITAEVFQRLGARVDKKIYPRMGHTINDDEIGRLKAMILAVLNS